MAERPLSDHLWDSSGQITSTGSANAYVLGIAEQLSGYYQGMPPIRFKANFTNTDSATANVVTQNAPSGLGAKTLKKGGGASNLESGDIVSGGIYTLSYDGTNLQVLELNSGVPTSGMTTIASGSLPAAANLDITGIPGHFAKLLLIVSGASSNTATRTVVVLPSDDNGASYDSTAGNFIGLTAVAGASPAALAIGSLLNPGAVAAASATSLGILIDAYQSPSFKYVTGTSGNSTGTKFHTTQWFGGVGNPLNALRIAWDGSGNFDAGTYALYGIS